MHNEARRTSVCREDVLTKRGANPRTGIVSPCILSGNSDASDGNDYVHVGWVQKERGSTAPANERWRQDDLGWSLVGCASDYSNSEVVATSSSDLSTTGTNRKQIHASGARARATSGGQLLKGPIETDGKTDHSIWDDTRGEFTRKDTDLASNGSTSSLVDRRLPSQSLFRIPRKAVGSRKSSPEARSDHMQRENPIFGPYGHHTASKDKASRSFLPACLDSTALGFHAYPSQPSRIRSPQSCAPQARHRYGNLGVRDPYLTTQGFRSPNRYASFGTSPSLAVNPNLESTYRRPKELLPVRLRGLPTLDSRDAHKKRDINRITNKDKAIEQRPQFKRVIATTSVPVTYLVKDLENTVMNKTEAPLSLDRARAASSPYQGATSGEEGPTLTAGALDASTCAARKAFRLTQAWKPGQEMTQKALVEEVVERSLPLLNRDNFAITEQPAFPDKGALGKQSTVCNRTRSKDSSLTAVETDFAERPHRSPAVGRQNSKRDTKELFDSLLVVTDELSSLIDYGRLQRQLHDVIKQALLTFHQAPWAIRTLRSQDAEVWDYFLAVRHMMMAMLYLVMLLSVLAAVLKVLGLIVDIGRCFWYPVGLLITTIQWIMLY
ncbi:MAG: hypothetical protein Q9188_003077 [Gyalolechia gomerana]